MPCCRHVQISVVQLVHSDEVRRSPIRKHVTAAEIFIYRPTLASSTVQLLLDFYCVFMAHLPSFKLKFFFTYLTMK
jgi:hypothetical protein